MECNKDEAFKAKELAEKKLLQKDIQEAHELAIKAHNLFPALDGLSQLISTLDVYLSAERRIYGEVDWYGVLGVVPLADDETIRKNYLKLVLNLHPDKNKAAGAEGAFKLVSEAWSLLTDKARKTAYDQKLLERATYFVPAGYNGFRSSVVNQQKTSNRQYAQIFPRLSKPNTFWTQCSLCLMHYEYLREHLLHRLICPSCRHPFLAVEIPIPFPNMQLRTPNHHASANNPTPDVGGVGQTSSLTGQQGQSPKSGTSGSSSVELKRGRESETDVRGEGALQTKSKVEGSAKKRRVDELNYSSKNSTGGDRVILPSRNKLNNTSELSLSETQVMLMTKAKNEIRKKLNEWDLASKEEVKKVQKDNPDAPTVDMKKASVSGVEPTEFMSMSVPDPDFHDFDQERTENSFGEKEVWATYDDDDGMPRFYALVNRVISRRPFSVKIGRLNSKSNAELGPINWVGSGFRKTTGKFHIGKYEVNQSLNGFSHKVKFTKGIRGVIQIFPVKGDVWALYKNWSPEWNELTDAEVIHKYEMVLVVEDYIEDRGVTVTPLVKVAGFKSVFQQHLDLRKVWKIPKEEMFRFSHQVPSHMLTGQEAQNVPKGCRELDPAALPSELVQVLTEVELVENIENVEEELPKKSEGKCVITYSRKTVGRNAKD